MTKENFYEYFGVYLINLWNTLIEIKTRQSTAQRGLAFTGQ